jgi:hypothetical protein
MEGIRTVMQAILKRQTIQTEINAITLDGKKREIDQEDLKDLHKNIM